MAARAGGEYVDWRDGEAYALHYLTSPAVLCVDEVGNTRYRDWATGHLHRVILVRESMGLETWLASNYSPADLAQHPHPDMVRVARIVNRGR